MKEITPAVPVFPADHSNLPRTGYGLANSYEAKLMIQRRGMKVRGWMIGKTRDGRTRKYRFEATMGDGGPIAVTVSLADPRNDNAFDDRDGPPRAIREISGLARGARSDLIERATRLAGNVRDSYLAEQKFLERKFDGGRLARDANSEETTIRRSGDWLVTRHFGHGTTLYSARFDALADLGFGSDAVAKPSS